MDNKRGLGKGIRALITDLEQTASEGPVTEIPITRIRPNPYQPRKHFDPDKLAELSESIRTHGVLQPLVVREKDGGYELIAGERRFQASKLAGLSAVPAVIRDCSDEVSLELAIVENVQREDIAPLEAAMAYKRLSDEFGHSQEEIAKRVGKSRSAVANTLRLLNLPEEVRTSLADGEITEGHARALLGISDKEELLRVWEYAIQTMASVRDTERLVREALNTKTESPSSPSNGRSRSRGASARVQDPNLLQIESDLRRMLGTKVEIRRSGNKGGIFIEFYSDEDLERILGLIAQ